jgi:hypothetical protein
VNEGRKRLTLRAPEQDVDAPSLFRRAIEDRICVRATYNRTAIKLAPHALYTRHGDFFVDGVVLERNGEPPREPKLGTFKLAGLTALRPTRSPFSPAEMFDRDAAKYRDEAVQVVRSMG